jgi:hypothetical protein
MTEQLNAAKAIDAGAMPAFQLHDELNAAISDDVRAQFHALDEARAKDEAEEIFRKIDGDEA